MQCKNNKFLKIYTETLLSSFIQCTLCKEINKIDISHVVSLEKK
jgi:hypothetical protein